MLCCYKIVNNWGEDGMFTTAGFICSWTESCKSIILGFACLLVYTCCASCTRVEKPLWKQNVHCLPYNEARARHPVCKMNVIAAVSYSFGPMVAHGFGAAHTLHCTAAHTWVDVFVCFVITYRRRFMLGRLAASRHTRCDTDHALGQTSR